MAERWGPCRSCKGHGSRFIEHIDEDTGETVRVIEECGTCGGTGQSGDIQDYHG